jgi:hypothetical protein
MHAAGGVYAPVTETHRWSLAPPWQGRRRPLPFDEDTRAFLWRLRWRQQPPSPRQRWTILLLVLVFHALALLGLRASMRPHGLLPPTVERTAQVIQVDLIEPAAPPAPSPVPPQVLPPLEVRAPSQPAAVSRHVQVKPNPQAMSAHLQDNAEPRVFDERGDVLLPAGAASTPPAPVPGYRVALPQATPGLMEHKSPIEYKPTRFEKDWVPPNENALESAIRKTTVSGKVLKLPGGYSVKCVGIPLMLVGACGIAGPDQLSAPLRVEHKRDNLAPATPLIKPKKKAQPAPAKAASVARPASVASPAGIR